MSSPARDDAPHRGRLAFAVGGAPAAWASHLGLSYLIVPESCRWGTAAALHAVTAVTFAVALASVVVAVRLRSTPDGGDDARFAGTAGFIIGGVFLVAIVAEGLLPFLLDPCR